MRSLAAQPRMSDFTSPDINCHQGITTDGEYFYGFDTNAIRKFDRDWNLLDENHVAASSAGVGHIGDGEYYDGKLYVVAENYTTPEIFDSTRFAIFDADTLDFIEFIPITTGHEVSGLSIDVPRNTIYVSSYGVGPAIYKYRLSDFAYLGMIPLYVPIQNIQSIAYKDDFFYVGEDVRDRIFKINMFGRVQASYRTSVGIQEGLDFSTEYLYSLDDPGSEEFVHRIPMVSVRRPHSGGNMIPNGDFSYQPPQLVATTEDNTWINNTALGNPQSGFGNEDIFCWGLNEGGSGSGEFVYVDDVPALKIATLATASFVEVSLVPGSAPARNLLNHAIKVKPLTAYRVSFMMKTNVTSGDATNGAQLNVGEINFAGTTLINNTTAARKVTGDWEAFTLDFTTGAATDYVNVIMRIYGHQGAATLIMEAWFKNLLMLPIVPSVGRIAS